MKIDSLLTYPSLTWWTSKLPLPPVMRLPAPSRMRPSFLYVDVDELAGPFALVALRGLQAEPAKSTRFNTALIVDTGMPSRSPARAQ